MTGENYRLVFNDAAGGKTVALDPILDSNSQEYKNIQRANIEDPEGASHIASASSFSYNVALDKKSTEKRKKENREKLSWLQIIHQINEWMKESFSAIGNMIYDNKPIELALDDIDFARQQIEKLDEKIELLQNAIKNINGGNLGRNPDGTLENADLQKLLDENKKKTGKDLTQKGDLFLRDYFVNQEKEATALKDYYVQGGHGMVSFKEKYEQWQIETNKELTNRKQEWQDILEMPDGTAKEVAVEEFRDNLNSWKVKTETQKHNLLKQQSNLHTLLHTDPDKISQNIEQFAQEMTLALTEIRNNSAHSNVELEGEMMKEEGISFGTGLGSMPFQAGTPFKP